MATKRLPRPRDPIQLGKPNTSLDFRRVPQPREQPISRRTSIVRARRLRLGPNANATHLAHQTAYVSGRLQAEDHQECEGITMDLDFRELTSEEMSAVAGGAVGLLGGGLGTLVDNLLSGLVGGSPEPPLLIALLAWVRRGLGGLLGSI